MRSALTNALLEAQAGGADKLNVAIAQIENLLVSMPAIGSSQMPANLKARLATWRGRMAMCVADAKRYALKSQTGEKRQAAPDDLREANRLGNREHFADSADGFAPIDLRKAEVDQILAAFDRPEVGGEVDLQALKHPPHMLVRGILSEDPSKNYNCGLAQGWNNAIDHLASRNLLKSEGVCVPGEIVETLKSIKLQTEFFTQDGISEDVLRNTLKQIDIIVSEAIRPFLPAEKE